MTHDELVSHLDVLLKLISRQHVGSEKHKEYLDYYTSVVTDDDIRPTLKGTKHWYPTKNDIREDKINQILN